MCYLNDPIKFFAFSNIKKVQYDLIFIVVFFYLNFQFPKIKKIALVSIISSFFKFRMSFFS